MECLIKYVTEECSVSRHEDSNDIDNFPLSKRKSKIGKWTYKDTLSTKEDYLKYYAVKTCEVRLSRTTIVLESDDNKIAIKIYHYLSFRTVGVHYFRKQQTLQYLTYNKKTNIVYVGSKYGKKTTIRSNPFQNGEITLFFNSLYNNIKNRKLVEGIQDSNKLFFDIANTFFENAFTDKTNLIKYTTILDSEKIFLDNYIKVNNIIVSNNYDIFFKNEQITLREIKRAKNNLLLAVEKKYKIKGKKFHRVLHSLEYFNPFLLKNLIIFFGIDFLKQLTDDDLKAIISIPVNTFNSNEIALMKDEFTLVEKKRIMNIFLDCIHNNGSFRTFMDHLNFIYTLRYQYNETLSWDSKTRDEFTKEHVFLSNLIAKYQTGIYDRTYTQEFMDSFNTQFVHNGGVYYPVLLSMDSQYKDESEVQHNCVKTYTKDVKSCIISLREGSPNSSVRATIQYSFVPENRKISLVRLQTLGRFNKYLEDNWNKPVYMLDEHMEQVIKKFKLDDYKIIKTTYAGSKVYDVTSDFSVMFDDEKTLNNFLDNLDF
jgi:hypothetical protein